MPETVNWIGFGEDLQTLLNKYGVDADLGIPDFILQHYLAGALSTLRSTKMGIDMYEGRAQPFLRKEP